MAKTMTMAARNYSDAAYIEGLLRKDGTMEELFYTHCKDYFDRHYRGVFFANDNDKYDIFHNTYISLWENIERGKIYVKDGRLVGRHNKPFNGSLTTYMMSIARLKYMEWVRKETREPNAGDMGGGVRAQDEPAYTEEWLCDDEHTAKLEVISDCIAVMSQRCNEIITKFYGECKSLDTILGELGTFNSKDALKTAKNKCMAKLKKAASSLYGIRKNM